MFNIYGANDLYKCFLLSLCDSGLLGGILILPVGFFLSPRKIDFDVRDQFLSRFEIKKVNYFEEQVFQDTKINVCAFEFKKASEKMKEQMIPWVRYPQKEERIFNLSRKNKWIIGGEIYDLGSEFKLLRNIEGRELKENERQTFLTLSALDSGREDGRVSLLYEEDRIYWGKLTSRTYATLITQDFELNKRQQKRIMKAFNQLVEEKREEYWSLWLPNYRENTRKRIPFELSYSIISHLIAQL